MVLFTDLNQNKARYTKKPLEVSCERTVRARGAGQTY